MSFQEYVGKTETRSDTVWPTVIRGLAATLDIPEQEVAPGGRLPPLWHWMLFQEWAPAHGLGPDGHPKRGGFLPPVHDLPRRMWAGGRVRFL
ncbi:MAG: acyl-CoA dehydrogenase, partial [Alphaproteobacteria bacterium]|nr:acyl-CoA dehydrogenase [Alphaproteobacteria bacterium]